MKAACKIPLIGPLFSFDSTVLRDSLRELAILWFFSTLPIFFSGISELQSKSFELWITDLLNVKVLFVYTTSFLSTILLLLIDRVVFPRREKIFYGATLIFCAALVILIFSAYAYGNGGLDTTKYSKISYFIYFLSVYFWLLAIADTKKDGSNFNKTTTDEENDFTRQASQRSSRGRDKE